MRKSCGNCTFVSRKQLKKSFLPKNIHVFSIFSAFEHKIKMSLAMKFWHEGRNWFFLVLRIFLTKLTFLKKKFVSLHHKRTSRMKFSDFGFKVSAGLSKVQLTCPLKLLFRICSFFKKFINFLSIFGFDWCNSDSFRNYCGKFVKTSFYVSIWTIRGDFLSLKNLISFFNEFRTCETKQKIIHDCQKPYHVSIEFFVRRCFFLKNSYIFKQFLFCI